MSLEPYEHYKEAGAGVSWMTRMPTSWGVRRVKCPFRERKRIVGEEGPDVLSVTQQGIRIIRHCEQRRSVSNGLFFEVSDCRARRFCDESQMDLLTGWIDITTTFGVRVQTTGLRALTSAPH